MKRLVHISSSALILMSLSVLMPAVMGDEPQPATQADKSSDACSPERIFRAKLHEAIYAALKYPAQTAYHAATGLTTVEYDYLNGHATNIHVTDPSGDSLLDRVAAAAVNGAKYPLPGPELVDKTIHDTVFVIFDNTGQLRRGSGYHLVDSSQDKTSAKPQDSRCAGN